MSRLRKPSSSNMKSTKYLVNCQENVDASDDKWLEIIRKIKENDILVGKMSYKNVVIKFGKNDPIQKEYEISKKIYECNIPNFIVHLLV